MTVWAEWAPSREPPDETASVATPVDNGDQVTLENAELDWQAQVDTTLSLCFGLPRDEARSVRSAFESRLLRASDDIETRGGRWINMTKLSLAPFPVARDLAILWRKDQRMADFPEFEMVTARQTYGREVLGRLKNEPRPSERISEFAQADDPALAVTRLPARERQA